MVWIVPHDHPTFAHIFNVHEFALVLTLDDQRDKILSYARYLFLLIDHIQYPVLEDIQMGILQIDVQFNTGESITSSI
jgi:hypothetical protein